MHKLIDYTSGKALPMDSGDPFWSTDLTLENEDKILYIQTNDFTMATIHTLVIEVSYLPYTLPIWPCSSEEEESEYEDGSS